MRSLIKLAKEKETSGMLSICEDMISKTRILLNLWDPGLVEEALAFLEKHKVAKVPEIINHDDSLMLNFPINQSLSPFKRITQQLNFDLKSPDFDDFVTPTTPECVKDIWKKESSKNKYKNLSVKINHNIKDQQMDENLVLFSEVSICKKCLHFLLLIYYF
jgi:inositol polyphosphate-4-phosphatase